MPDYKTPGVYIEELPATGPIAGVGTSNVAFIGPAKQGPINVPIKIVNWTQFKDVFGDYMVAPRSYLAYAVRSFFENGGTVAWIVRAGNAVRSFKDLDDDDSTTTNKYSLHVEAREEGTGGDSIGVQVGQLSAVTGVNIQKARAQINANKPKDVVTMKTPADAAKFAVGDWVTIEGTGDRVQIDRILNDQIFLKNPLTGAAANDWLRIDDVKNQKSFRVDSAGGLEAGSAINITDNATTNLQTEDAVIASVNGSWITLDANVTKTYKLGQTDPQPTISSYEFSLKYTKTGTPAETYTPLAMDPRHSRYWSRVVSSQLVIVTAPPPASATQSPPPKNRPTVTTTTLAGGQSDSPPPPLASFDAALTALERIDDVNVICVPDRTDTAFQNRIVAHCEQLGRPLRRSRLGARRDPFDRRSANAPRAPGTALSSARGYAALYYPWLACSDPASPTGEDPILVPPSGHVAGIFARTRHERGVHKAPANEVIRGASASSGARRRRAGPAQHRGHQRACASSRAAARRSSGARARPPPTATRLALRQRPPAVPLHRGVDPGGHALGGLRAERPRRLEEAASARSASSSRASGATARCSARRPRRRSTCRIDEELNPAVRAGARPAVIEIGVAPVRPGRVHRRPHRPVGRRQPKSPKRRRGAMATDRRSGSTRTATSTSSSRSTASRRRSFTECSGLGSTTEVIEYREGGDNTTVRKLPGKTSTPTSRSSGA